MNAYLFSNPTPVSGNNNSNRLRIPDLVPDPMPLTAEQHPFTAWRVSQSPRMVFNIPRYLEAKLDRFLAFGGKLSIKEIKKLEEQVLQD